MAHPTPSIAPDAPPALADVLRHIEMTGIFYCPAFLGEPWGLQMPAMEHCVWFHAVTTGHCTLRVGQHHLELHAGDVALVPHGDGHHLTGRQPAATPLVHLLEHEEITGNYAILRHGGDGARTELVCGGLRLDHPVAQRLIGALPEIIHIESSRARRSAWTSLDLLAEEMDQRRIGSDAIISRLCDIVVLQAIRTWVERRHAHSSQDHGGWLSALCDPRLGAALTAVHRQPDAPWSVESLAAEALMSRSAFAARFTEVVGQPAMQYLTELRMQLACSLLNAGERTVAEVAAAVGYRSEASFSRAFKRAIGCAPRAARPATGSPRSGPGLA